MQWLRGVLLDRAMSHRCRGQWPQDGCMRCPGLERRHEPVSVRVADQAFGSSAWRSALARANHRYPCTPIYFSGFRLRLQLCFEQTKSVEDMSCKKAAHFCRPLLSAHGGSATDQRARRPPQAIELQYHAGSLWQRFHQSGWPRGPSGGQPLVRLPTSTLENNDAH